MDKDCKIDGGSIYFLCRKEAAKYNDKLNSREGASELLCVSESSLRNYELMLTPVPVDVVVRMADLYGAPELEACYCKTDCPIGKRASTAAKLKSIEQITCSLLYHADDEKMERIKSELLRVARDGKVDPQEKEVLHHLAKELTDLESDIAELRLYMKKYGGIKDGAD